MKYKVLFILLILINGCKSLSKSELRDFTIKDSYYQSWYLNENEKGFEISIVLKNIKPNIHFQSLVFRGVELAISIKRGNDSIILSANHTLGLSKLKQKFKINKGENRIIYKLNNVEKTYIIKNLSKRKTIYY